MLILFMLIYYLKELNVIDAVVMKKIKTEVI